LHPLSTVGSLAYIGGRFNIGQEVNSGVPSFPALYVAKDKDTALQEHLAQIDIVDKNDLTPRDLALTNPQSETIISVSGWLETIFDLTDEKNLTPLTDIIKEFKINPQLVETARQLSLQEPKIITTVETCLKNLLAPDWRKLPSRFDVPSTSQIFGHLVYSAGIEGILYNSKFTSKSCLAMFPHNFKNTKSFLIMDDETPHDMVPMRVDATSWYFCDLDIDEITSHFNQKKY
jgi:hypothetical protein